MFRVLFILAIIFAVLHTQVGLPVLHYLENAAAAITRSFNP